MTRVVAFTGNLVTYFDGPFSVREVVLKFHHSRIWGVGRHEGERWGLKVGSSVRDLNF